MKQTLKLIGLLALTLILSSCSKSKDEMDPIGESSDIIKLSTKTIHFDKSKIATTITTKGDGWWINGEIPLGFSAFQR